MFFCESRERISIHKKPSWPAGRGWASCSIAAEQFMICRYLPANHNASFSAISASRAKRAVNLLGSPRRRKGREGSQGRRGFFRSGTDGSKKPAGPAGGSLMLYNPSTIRLMPPFILDSPQRRGGRRERIVFCESRERISIHKKPSWPAGRGWASCSVAAEQFMICRYLPANHNASFSAISASRAKRAVNLLGSPQRREGREGSQGRRDFFDPGRTDRKSLPALRAAP